MREMIEPVVPPPLDHMPTAPPRRQSSILTLEEPHLEPVPSEITDTSEESKRRTVSRASTGSGQEGYVKKRVAQTESEILRREALKELRRLSREDRRRARTAAETGPVSSSAAPAEASARIEPTQAAIEEQ